MPLTSFYGGADVINLTGPESVACRLEWGLIDSALVDQ